MLNSVSDVTQAHAKAVDGDIGPIEDVLFDDRNWVIRYLVVNAGTWLAERDVLVSPYSIKQPVGRDKLIDVALTRRLVRTSPALDTGQPVSRQQEQEFMRHYHYPAYWDGGGLWARGGKPYPSIAPLPGALHAPETHAGEPDMQLRSADQVSSYEIHAANCDIGLVQDFVFDDESWQIRYLVVDIHSGQPEARKVLIGLPWVERIDWEKQQIHVTLTPEQVQCGPDYQDVASIHRDYEIQLHANYQRPGYWA